jgi:hypothetical protein
MNMYVKNGVSRGLSEKQAQVKVAPEINRGDDGIVRTEAWVEHGGVCGSQ